MRRVQILESPALGDLRGRAWEGDHLKESLRLFGVPCEHSFISDLAEFVGSMASLSQDRNSDIVHIAGHGNEKAFGFTNGQTASWEQFASFSCLASKDKVVCISACQAQRFNVYQADKVISEIFAGVKVNRPRAVLLLSGQVPLSAAVMTWSLLYWHLASVSIEDIPARKLFEVLSRVKAAELKVPLCAHYWSEKHGCFVDISPWKGYLAEVHLKAIESGEKLPFSTAKPSS